MTPGGNWLQEGREVGVTLDACHAVVVVGSDPVATSEVALGIARVQAQHRRVAVADMFGDAAPLIALVPDQDPHGLVDSFLFGVSLNRIAYQVPDAGELFIMPSGTAPLDYEELFVSPRWRKLAAGFGEMGALLIVAAPAEAPNVRALVDVTDGAVLVGDVVPPDLPVAMSLAWLRTKRTAPMSVAMSLPPARAMPTGIETPAVPVMPRWRRYAGPAGGIAVATGIAALGLWFANRPFASHRGPVPVSTPGTATTAAAASGGSLAPDTAAIAARDAARRDSLARDSAARVLPAAGADSFPVPAVSNPKDSAAASAWGVLLEETLTRSGAILNLEMKYKAVPVGTYGVNPRTRFFPVFAGAFTTQAGADSLLASLRERHVLAPQAGGVTALPYAFLVQSDVPAREAANRVAFYRASGRPVYALKQPSGAMHLYFGAYATPQQAALAIPELRAAKLTPTLVYRIGRVF